MYNLKVDFNYLGHRYQFSVICFILTCPMYISYDFKSNIQPFNE